MTVDERITLDTNILVYAVDLDAGERNETARSVMGAAARKDCYLTVQALGEFSQPFFLRDRFEGGKDN